jgi:hypothetical protein
MKWLTTFLCLLVIPAFAETKIQETDDKKYFMSRQECSPFQEMFQTVTIKYGEQPLFIGKGIQFAPDGRPFTGGQMFFVNQDSGTFSLITLFADGTACMTAVGTNFEPYTEAF